MQDAEKPRLDLLKAELAHATLSVHKHTSRWAPFYEPNWPSTHASLVRAKLLFLGRLLRTRADDKVIAKWFQFDLNKSNMATEAASLARSTPS